MFFLELKRDDPDHLENDYLTPSFNFSCISDEKIHRAITKLGPHKAPSPNGIPNVLLTRCADLFIPHLGPIYHVTFKLNTYPPSWKHSTMIVLRKQGKPDYTDPNAH